MARCVLCKKVMNTCSTPTIHVITSSFDEVWRAHLISELQVLHPGADVRVGSGSFDDVFVWMSEFGTLSDLVMTVDTDDDEDEIGERFSQNNFDVRKSFDACVRVAEDLAEQVECEMKKIKRAWQRRFHPLRFMRSGVLSIAAGLFR